MPYTASVFYDGAPPMITAGELNKLGTGVARGQATADASGLAALAAVSAVNDAVTAITGRTRVVRTTDGSSVTGTTLVADDVLTVTLTGVANALFLVTFDLIYSADVNCMGTLSLAATNGHVLGSGGADVYWASFTESSTALHESAKLNYYSQAVHTGIRSGLPGNLGDTTTSAHLCTGYGFVRNGSSTDDLNVTFSSAETINAERAQTFSGMVLLAGSTMTVQQLT